MHWDLSVSLGARCKEQIKVRIQMRNTWLPKSSSGSSAIRLSTFVWHFPIYKTVIYLLFLTLTMTLGGKYSFLHFVKKETEAGNVII